MLQIPTNAFPHPRTETPGFAVWTAWGRRFSLSVFAMLAGIAGFAPSLPAEEIRFDKGSGTIIEGTKSPDGMFAVVVTADEQENVIVFLPERRQVLKLSGAGIQEGSFPYFPGLNHGGLSALWAPNQEGSSFGVLFYDAKWESAGVIFVDVDPEFGKQIDITPMLRKAAQEKAGRDLSFSFSPGGLDVPAGEPGIADPIDLRVNYLGQSPNNPDAAEKEGSVALRLNRTRTGPEVTLLKNAGGTPAVPIADPAPPAKASDPYRDLRDAINAEIESGVFKEVRLKSLGEGGRKISHRGYLLGTILSKLVYVDSLDEENRSITLYYWREGQLVSVFEVRKGADTQISEVGETVEIYNFRNEKLVQWTRDGENVPPGEAGFADAGASVLKQSIKRAEPIYFEIGAD